MELQKIQIRNFRSIKEEDILFPHNCMILIGKNEAGKSNILKAIAAVFGQYKVSNRDKRKKIDNEKIEDSYVRAIFKLNEIDFKNVLDRFSKEYKNLGIIKFKNNKTLYEFIETVFHQLLIQIDIASDKSPYYSYWRYNEKDFDLEHDLYLDDGTLSTAMVTLVHFDLKKELFRILKETYLKVPFNCLYWQYSDDYLLPNSILISDLISNPKHYSALNNIFHLCERSEIEKEFNAAKLEDGDYSNLLEQVSKKITTTFQKIWKDFKGTSIQLLPNGEEILIKVVDKAKYNFEDRSDGFKKIISILLMLSTQARTKRHQISDIILIDEPDQSLYPTSAQYLRDELIEISKSSKMVYSTHSQYMIDSNHLDRHYIVEKKDDITTITKDHTNAPFITDELFRRAIGSSIFDCLQPINIIFEGYLDKQLFDSYCRLHNKEKDFKQYGKVYLSGISSTDTLVQLLLLAQKKFIIVADSDETSKNKRNDFSKHYADYKENWLAYGDLKKELLTMEDFFCVEHVQSGIIQENANYQYDLSKTAIQNIENAVNKDKERKQEIKNNLTKSLKKENYNEYYKDFMELLSNKLQNL